MDLGWPYIAPEPPFGGDQLVYVTIEVKGTPLKIWYEPSDIGILIRSIEGADITATHLKALRLGEIREELQRVLREDPDRLHGPAYFGKLIEDGIKDGTASATEEEREWYRAARRSAEVAVAQLPAPGPKPGRGADHDFYREVAIAYLETLKAVGKDGKPIKTMAEKWCVPRDKVAVWVRRARDTGWLEKEKERDIHGRVVTQGSAYGGEGPELKKWRSKQEEQP